VEERWEQVPTEDPAVNLWGQWTSEDEFQVHELRVTLEEPLALRLGRFGAKVDLDLDLQISEVSPEDEGAEPEEEG